MIPASRTVTQVIDYQLANKVSMLNMEKSLEKELDTMMKEAYLAFQKESAEESDDDEYDYFDDHLLDIL